MDLETSRILEPILMDFEDAWQSPSPPEVPEFLARAPEDLRTELICELALIDLEHRFRKDSSANADVYLKLFPEIYADQQRRTDLIRFEARLRSGIGSPATESELHRRFPNDPMLQELRASQNPPPNSPIDLELSEGRRLGTYVIHERVGSGTFADVYRSEDLTLNRTVALKFLKPWTLKSDQLRSRMLREAQAVASLQHPNVVPVYEIREHDGRDYIASRFIDGCTLAEWTERVSPTNRDTVRVIARLASALEAAHSNGIVHRDVKPDNVMMEDNSPMLLDFGLAHFANAASELTVEGDLVGTPAYMSPEQASGIREVGPASDIYSLGVILYQMISGRLPFTGTPSLLLHQTIHADPVPPARLNPEIPVDLQTICMKTLAKSPTDRYASAQHMADDLWRHYRNEPVLARRRGAVERLARTALRYPIATTMAVLLLVLSAAGIGGYIQYQNVVTERNRATAAESRTRELLARDAAVTGRMAQRRGETQTAVSRFRNAIARGHEDVAKLSVSIAECELNNGNFDLARDALNRTDSEALSTQDRARWLLVQAQLVLTGKLKIESTAIELIEKIPPGQLREADRYFLAGLNADNTRSALNSFQRAYELDSHHFAARRLAALMAFLLADFEQSLLICDTSIQLFTDNSGFVLIKAMACSATDSHDQSSSLIESAGVGIAEKERWRDICKFVASSCERYDTGDLRVFTDDQRRNSEFTTASMIELLGVVRDDYKDLAARNQWFLPPRVAAAFSEFITEAEQQLARDRQTGLLASLSKALSGNDRPLPAVRAIVIAHPEASLKTTIARDALDRWGTSTENLKYVQQLFEQSLRESGFLVGTETHAQVGAYLAAMGLARVRKVDVEQNAARSNELLAEIDPQLVHDPEMLRVLSLGPLQETKAWELADGFITRWVEVSQAADDRDMLINALWTRAVLLKNQESWFRVLNACDELLKTYPPDERPPLVDPEGLKVVAVIKLINAVHVEGAEFDWKVILIKALQRGEWRFASAAAAEIDRLVREDSEDSQLAALYLDLSTAMQREDRNLAKRLVDEIKTISPEWHEELSMLRKGL